MESTKICDGYIGLCRKHTTILFMPESNATYCGCFIEHFTFHDWIYVESLTRARAQNAPYNVLSEHCSVFTNHRMKFVGMRMYDCVCACGHNGFTYKYKYKVNTPHTINGMKSSRIG